MSARQLLDQLLQSGQGLLSDATNRVQGATGGAGGGKASFLTGLGGGALGAGALGLLMGSKKARKIGGKVAMYGGMAALGALAYRAYGDWQRNQAGGAQAAPPQTLDRLPAPEAEQHSNAVLTAMIGAAKADGHIGPEERGLLETELAKLSSDAQDRQWLETELSRPLDPASVAQSAKTPEMAAEMYLASLLVVDEESYMERAYLDELARQLKLEPGLKEKLEQHAKSAVA
ncbi:tellurite resistance TerB family protein [Achromobacter spanius]|uniref:tellurite resistance TerB family protein n=1 Tax=Achromobacter spanius TaxID=217203 RepID=UPI000F8FA57C|nr:tellurite resistance TerB family protein [Achromobacter spanius]AZS77643.1 tellurite resistance TerB family protein [Achromobacter spanius]MCW3156059.1 tellurite resistance TerB family protein [Achromobacter spanius]